MLIMARTGEQPFSVVILDLNGFKVVNDTIWPLRGG
jgi:GGDEF domain-containing protein